MPSKLFSLNEVPPVLDDKSPNERIMQLYNYLLDFRVALNYILQNLDTDNWNAVSLKKLTDGIQSKVTASVNEKINVGDIVEKLSGATEKANSAYDVAVAVRDRLDLILPFVEMLMEFIRINEDGGISIGIEGYPLHLLGEVYINDMHWTEG